MANKKYELMKDDTIKAGSKTLYRIKALRDIGDEVEEGDEGGYIESEKNLSQKGECWISDNGIVYGNAKVGGDVLVSGDHTAIFGNAEIYFEAGSPKITNCEIYGNVKLFGENMFYGTEIKNSEIFGKVQVLVEDGHVTIWDSKVHDNAIIKDSVITGMEIKDKATIHNADVIGKKGEVGKNTTIQDIRLTGGKFSILIDDKKLVISKDTVGTSELELKNDKITSFEKFEKTKAKVAKSSFEDAVVYLCDKINKKLSDNKIIASKHFGDMGAKFGFHCDGFDTGDFDIACSATVTENSISGKLWVLTDEDFDSFWMGSSAKQVEDPNDDERMLNQYTTKIPKVKYSGGNIEAAKAFLEELFEFQYLGDEETSAKYYDALQELDV